MVFGSSNNNVGNGFPPNIYLSPPPYPPTLSGNFGDIFASSVSALSPLSQNQGDTFTYSASSNSNDLFKRISKSKGRDEEALLQLSAIVTSNPQEARAIRKRLLKNSIAKRNSYMNQQAQARHADSGKRLKDLLEKERHMLDGYSDDSGNG